MVLLSSVLPRRVLDFLRYRVTQVSCHLELHDGGIRLIFEHTGFSSVGGLVVSKILASVRKKMLGVGLPAVLDEIDEDGKLLPGSSLARR
jgi:hypothetical protein